MSTADPTDSFGRRCGAQCVAASGHRRRSGRQSGRRQCGCGGILRGFRSAAAASPASRSGAVRQSVAHAGRAGAHDAARRSTNTRSISARRAIPATGWSICTSRRLPEQPDYVVVMLQERIIADKMDRQLTHRGAARSVIALAAMLAHEIKNPLSGIRGAAQLLEQSVGDDDRTLTRLICDEADRIVKLVDRMEVFADERPVEREPINIHVVLDHVKRLAQSGVARHIKFVEDYDPSLPPVLANRDQLVQVFLNLVKNAAEAIGDNSGRRDRALDRISPRRAAVRSRRQDPHFAAARVLREGQRAGRARGADAASVRSVRDHQADRIGARPRAGRQDRRRSRRHHRMRVAAAANDLSRSDAEIHGSTSATAPSRTAPFSHEGIIDAGGKYSRCR